MKRLMLFKQFYYDARILSGVTTNFFTESEENNDSVTLMSEDDALRWLFSSTLFFRSFAEEFFSSPDEVFAFFGTTQPFTTVGSKPGDIDLILMEKNIPHRAVAFECKRLKVTSVDKEYSKVNNVNGIREGVKQTNFLQGLGFYKSYLLLILLDDSRRLDYANTMMRNSKSDNVEEIYDIPWNEPLHEDAGIVFVKVTQPTGKHFNSMGGVGICIDKNAKEKEQTPQMTNKVKQLISSNKNLPE